VTPPLDRFDWERLIRETEIPPMTKLVALTLATFANGDGTRAHPGETRLAAAVGMKERAVRNHVTILRDLGLIKRVSRGGSSRRFADVYELHVPGDLRERLARHGWKLRHDGAGDEDAEADRIPVENQPKPVENHVDNPATNHDHPKKLRHARAITPARWRTSPAPRCRPPITYTNPHTKPLCRFPSYFGAVEGGRARDGPPDKTLINFDDERSAHGP
jgi:DNA-binding transcriptional ArsR family regulator